MRLTRLELKGFKSFRDKTVLEFPDKFTGVVGPNGSGKSNTTEAICFVLGKSRGLRAANLQELIFNGGLSGEPAQKAVVAITLRDDSGQKHRITRIVDREGNSVYKLNDKKTTRQKIMEIAGDSEYNIILQDDITKVVEMRPKDRRKIIDDLCGIGVYDDKRDKALTELEKVEERISQTHIILGEKQGYMNSLRKERDEALKYTKTRDQLRSARASLLTKEISSLERRDERISEQVAEITRGRQEAIKRISDIKAEIHKKTEHLRQVNSQLIRLEEEKQGTKITEVRGEIARHQDKIDLLTKQLEALDAEEKDKRGSLTVVSADRRESEGLFQESETKFSIVAKQLETQTAKSVDLAVETELDLVKNRIYESRSRIKALQEQNGKKQLEQGVLAKERESLEDKLKVDSTEEQGSIKQVEQFQMDYDRAMSDFKKFESQYSLANEQVNTLRQTLEEQRLTLTKKQSEISAILRTSGGLQHAVRAIISLKKVIPGIFGPVMQLGEVKDDRYAAALNVAAGNRMQFVVVQSVNDASKCIDYLKQKRIGRCTFLPLDKVNVKVRDRAPKESLGFARDFVAYSSKFSKVFEYVLGDTLLVKDIEAARAIGIGDWRMVTLDGDLLELSGAITGGHLGDRVEVTFNNIEEFEKEISALETLVAQTEAQYTEVLSSRGRLDATLMTLRERIRTSKEAFDGAGHSQNIQAERRVGIRERLNKVVESIDVISRDIQENSLEATKLEKAASADEKSLEELALRRGKGTVTKMDSLRDELRKFEVEKTKVAEKLVFLRQQGETLKARIQELGLAKDGISSELKSLGDGVRKLKLALDDLEQAHQSVGGEIKKLMDERGQTEVEITQISSSVGEIEGGMNLAAQQMQDFTIEKAKITTRLEDLRREFSKYEGVELIDKSVKDLEDMAAKMDQELTSFGSVNMRSIETFEVIKKEFEEITEKLETLKKERQSIFDFMDKIESKKRDTFMEAFDKVKANFERIYAQLSDGKGTLTLDNPMNISESGLIITASPGGKRLMSLDAMSGGEKVLTSSAFLLGLQQYKPAYFYIVDELDAALDKRNSVKLAQMLAASSSQFLMVTHNNNMLKYMDSAIGVSMINGVSQIVGVRFNEQTQSAVETALPSTKEAQVDIDDESIGEEDKTPPQEPQ
jgi:chromosome segregation protein